MADKDILQRFHDSSQHTADQIKQIQNAIKKLNTSRKDSEQKQQKELLINSLSTFIHDLEELCSKAVSTKQSLEKSLGNTKDQSQKEDSNAAKKNDNAADNDKQKRLPLPEDQENMYCWKAKMMPQYQEKNHALQAEVLLKNRRNLLRAQRYHNQLNYNRETNLSAVTTLHTIHLYEKKAKAAEARAKMLQEELDALKGNTQGQGQITSKSADQSGQSFLGPNNRINDVIRRSEVLSVENKTQQHEIQRLKKDNSDLTLKAKHAQQDKHQILSQLSTSEMARKDLYSRFQKQKDQHDRLNRSLNRQSASWIESRKQNDQLEEDIRWANVGHADPTGGFERTHMHPISRNVDRPRQMYPVEHYSQPIKS